jgi:hypothetical protein
MNQVATHTHTYPRWPLAARCAAILLLLVLIALAVPSFVGTAPSGHSHVIAPSAVRWQVPPRITTCPQPHEVFVSTQALRDSAVVCGTSHLPETESV